MAYHESKPEYFDFTLDISEIRSRKQAEELHALCNKVAGEIADELLKGGITGFQANECWRRVEAERERLERKMMGIRLSLIAKEAEKGFYKHVIFWKPDGKTGGQKFFLKTSVGITPLSADRVRWMQENEAPVLVKQAAAYFGGQSNRAEAATITVIRPASFKWEKIQRDESKKYLDAGMMVWIPDKDVNAKGDESFPQHAFVRVEVPPGEGHEQTIQTVGASGLGNSLRKFNSSLAVQSGRVSRTVGDEPRDSIRVPNPLVGLPPDE